MKNNRAKSGSHTQIKDPLNAAARGTIGGQSHRRHWSAWHEIPIDITRGQSHSTGVAAGIDELKLRQIIAAVDKKRNGTTQNSSTNWYCCDRRKIAVRHHNSFGGIRKIDHLRLDEHTVVWAED